jgi:response regulator RpfG family c-di-GMP phosphodiesterase
MPQMSGPLVAAKVTAVRPGIKVLYMSGYTDDAVLHHGVLSHKMPFIQKPFSPVALRRKIRGTTTRVPSEQLNDAIAVKPKTG